MITELKLSVKVNCLILLRSVSCRYAKRTSMFTKNDQYALKTPFEYIENNMHKTAFSSNHRGQWQSGTHTQCIRHGK